MKKKTIKRYLVLYILDKWNQQLIFLEKKNNFNYVKYFGIVQYFVEKLHWDKAANSRAVRPF